MGAVPGGGGSSLRPAWSQGGSHTCYSRLHAEARSELRQPCDCTMPGLSQGTRTPDPHPACLPATLPPLPLPLPLPLPAGAPPTPPELSRSPLHDLFNFDLQPLREQEALAAPASPLPAGPSSTANTAAASPLLMRLKTSTSAQRLARLLPGGQEGSVRGQQQAAAGQGSQQQQQQPAGAGRWVGAASPLQAAPPPSSSPPFGSSPPASPGTELVQLERLRCQLEVVGTAGGLLDRRIMSAEGQIVGPTSPKQQQQQQGEQGEQGREGNDAGGEEGALPLPPGAARSAAVDDYFGDLEAEPVEEQSWGGSRSTSFDYGSSSVPSSMRSSRRGAFFGSGT